MDNKLSQTNTVGINLVTIVEIVHYLFSCFVFVAVFIRGFSTVELVENATSHKLYALKRITCHAQTDQKVGLQDHHEPLHWHNT